MKNPRHQSKPMTDEEPSKRRRPTASYRKDKQNMNGCERQKKQDEEKKKKNISSSLLQESLLYDDEGQQENSHDHSENENNQGGDDSENENIQGGEDSEEEEGGERDSSEEDGNGNEEESGDESDEEDSQDGRDEDFFPLYVDDEEYEYELYGKGHDHVAHHLKNKIDRGPLKCKQYTGKLWTWDLDTEPDGIKNMIKQTVLYKLCNGSYRSVNKVLVSAFVERWHPETTTFHMPFGEVTITLDDVEQLLSIPIIGKPMETDFTNVDQMHVWISGLLGIPVADVLEELVRCKGNFLRTSWIIKYLSRASNPCARRLPFHIILAHVASPFKSVFDIRTTIF